MNAIGHADSRPRALPDTAADRGRSDSFNAGPPFPRMIHAIVAANQYLPTSYSLTSAGVPAASSSSS